MQPPRQRRIASRIGVGVLAMAVAASGRGQPAALEDLSPWTPLAEVEGLALAMRRVEGSRYAEYRVATTTELPVDALCEHVFDWATRGTDGAGITGRTLLRDGGDERVSYDRISFPIVSDRDFALTMRRDRPRGGACRIRYWTTNHLAPPKPDGWVRLEKVWGAWVFEAAAEGTRLTYTLFADPAGSIPAFFVHRAQRNNALDSVRKALERTRRALGRTG